MRATDPHTWSLAETGLRLRAGEISSLELTRLYLKRIEALNGSLHAYVTVMSEEALRAAEMATEELTHGTDHGPLHGIPVSVKDHMAVSGYPTTCGTRARICTAHEEAAVVRRLKEAGAVVLGKTSLPELGLGSFHPSFPPVRNPWDLELSAEGSSVGCAAALTARLCLASIGSDAGGSIRRPAAHCGITGFMPTHGLVETEGILGMGWSSGSVGPLTLSVEDVYLTMLGILPPDRVRSLPSFEHPGALNRKWRENGDLPRLGVIRESLTDNLQVEWEAAFQEAVKIFQRQGAEIHEVSIPSWSHSSTALLTIILVEAVSSSRSVATEAGEGVGEEALFWLQLGRRIPGFAYVNAHRFRRQLINELREAFHEVDILMGPVTRGSPPALDQVTRTWSGEGDLDLGSQIRPTAPYNLVGIPALSLPCGFDSSQLPLGLQLAARRHQEGALLAVAWLYEQETGWWTHMPPIARTEGAG